MTSFLTTIVEDAWNDAVARPDIARWRSLAEMAKDIAAALKENDPNNIMTIAHRAVYEEAHKRMLALQPKEIAA